MSAEERWRAWSAEDAAKHDGVPWYRRGFSSVDIPLGSKEANYFGLGDVDTARYVSWYWCCHCMSGKILLTKDVGEIHDVCVDGTYLDGPRYTLDLATAQVIPSKRGEVPTEDRVVRAADIPWWVLRGADEPPEQRFREDFFSDEQWAISVEDARAMREAREHELMTYLTQERRRHGFVSCDSLRVEYNPDDVEKLRPPRYVCCHQKYRGVALGFVPSCPACPNRSVQLSQFSSVVDGRSMHLQHYRPYAILGSKLWQLRSHGGCRPGDKERILTVLLCALRYSRAHAGRFELELGESLPPEHEVRLPPELWVLVLGFLPVDVVLRQHSRGTHD